MSHSNAAVANGLEVTALDAGFGVRVRGEVLQALPENPSAVALLRGLLDRHRALVLADLHIDANAFVALAATLGELRPTRVRHASLQPPASDHVFVSARSAVTAPAAPAAPTPADAAHIWHMDYTQSVPVPRLSMLYAVKSPAHGSRTGFADMAAVYAALPRALRDEIEPLNVRHYKHPDGVDVRPPGTQASVSWAEREQGVAHPLVMRDAQGIPLLCLPARSDSPVVGLDEATGAALLDRLWSYVEPHGRPWEYEQASGDLLIWDNRALLHRRSAWPLNEERLIWFVSAN